MSRNFKSRILFLAIVLAASLVMQDCHLRKNKCDGCPAYKQHKRVRKTNKGSI